MNRILEVSLNAREYCAAHTSLFLFFVLVALQAVGIGEKVGESDKGYVFPLRAYMQISYVTLFSKLTISWEMLF